MIRSHIETALELAGQAGGAIGAVSTGLKALVDLLRRPNTDPAEIRARLVDLQEQLLTAKEAEMSTKNALLDLQREQMRRERFAQEASRYALAATGMGGFVYRLKPEDDRGEPPHDLCCACFEQEQKSILQKVGHNTLGCPRCKATVIAQLDRLHVVAGPARIDWDPLDPDR